MIFKDYGYSPDNFAALVAASGLTNEQFYTYNDMSRRTFYRYKSGDTSIDWQMWQLLVKKYEVNNGKA